MIVILSAAGAAFGACGVEGSAVAFVLLPQQRSISVHLLPVLYSELEDNAVELLLLWLNAAFLNVPSLHFRIMRPYFFAGATSFGRRSCIGFDVRRGQRADHYPRIQRAKR